MDNANELLQNPVQQAVVMHQPQNAQPEHLQNQQINLDQQMNQQINQNQQMNQPVNQGPVPNHQEQRKSKISVFFSAIKSRLAAMYNSITDLLHENNIFNEQIQQRINQIQPNPETVEAVTPLHHSRGKQFVAQGQHVLKFDLAGSGFTQFCKPHKDLDGHEEFNKVSKKTRWKMHDEYGERVKVAGKKLKYIRKKVTKDSEGNDVKTRITMAGPQNIGGLMNKGKYDIENLRNYMLILGSEYLKPIFETWELNPTLRRPINIIIKGHSRGAVAAGEGAMMLKAWVADHYPDYLDDVKFELTQYDPVPGLGSRSKHQEINHAGNLPFIKDGVKMMPLGANANTTVFYSMMTQYPAGFKPQAVYNANRVILTPFNHGIDLNKAEATQQGTFYRKSYKDAATGETYRSSGINELGEGLYITTSDHTLVRMDSANQAIALVNEYRKNKHFPDDRLPILTDVINKWFEGHNNQQPEQA